MREEIAYPSAVIDRRQRETWQQGGGTSAVQRASERVGELLRPPQPPVLPEPTRQALLEIMSRDARLHGMDRLPFMEHL
jgi:trimethylamine:corrinoid methyltransferase-like protein